MFSSKYGGVTIVCAVEFKQGAGGRGPEVECGNHFFMLEHLKLVKHLRKLLIPLHKKQ